MANSWKAGDEHQLAYFQANHASKYNQIPIVKYSYKFTQLRRHTNIKTVEWQENLKTSCFQFTGIQADIFHLQVKQIWI